MKEESETMYRIRIQDTLTFVALWVALLFIAPSYASAASVRQVTMDEMIQQSQLVFEGEVTAIENKETGPRRIHTLVTLTILDVIKGEYPSDSITLSFLGGTVGDVTLTVSDMVVPQVGEHGIYFVESLERLQVHPLYGWSQGHFLVETDDSGTDRVLTNGELPVTEVLGSMPADQMTAGQAPVRALSRGVARGISQAQTKKDARGMTADQFKKILREYMGVKP